MDAGELFKAGRLGEAIEAQISAVKTHPGDPSRRLFLFELLSFSGELDRASKQIDAIRYEDVELAAAIAVYRQLIDAERERRRVFKEGAAPRFFGAAPEHVALRLHAAELLRAGKLDECRATLVRAAEASPAVRGVLDGRPFESLCDCDDLLGSILEVMVRGEYYWVPLEQVKSLTLGPPGVPRDLIWAPAELELGDTTGAVFLPVLYPGTHEHADDRVKLGRLTVWNHGEEGLNVGAGSKVFQADENEVGLLEIRALRLVDGKNAAAGTDPPADARTAEGGEGS
jgi:type VI secretion system protein ImpE